MAAAPPPIRGSKVRLTGLSAAYLNGAIGTIMAEFDPELGRWPVRLISPSACVAQHPKGVKVKPENLEIVVSPPRQPRQSQRPEQPQQPRSHVARAGALWESLGGGPPLPLATRQHMAQAAIRCMREALDADLHPSQDAESLFGIQMMEGPQTRPDGERLSVPELPIGVLVYNAWSCMLKGIRAERTAGHADRAHVDREDDRIYHEFKRVELEFWEEVSDAMLAGELPTFFERQVCALLTSDALQPNTWESGPGVSAYGPSNAYFQELARRGFRGIQWDARTLGRIAGAV